MSSHVSYLFLDTEILERLLVSSMRSAEFIDDQLRDQWFIDSAKTSPTTGMNLLLGQAHYLALRASTLDLWLEITKSRKSVIRRFIYITKI
jgi:hypothetical protein